MFGTWYWNDSLFGQQIDSGDEITVKYDLFDRDSILVYDNKGNFVCEAKEVNKIHPAADLLGKPEQQEEFKNRLHIKKNLNLLLLAQQENSQRKKYSLLLKSN